MFHGLRILYLIIPPYSLITLGIILVICILSLYFSLRMNKIHIRQIHTKDQNLVASVFALFIISEVAMVLTTVFMMVFTNVVVSPLTSVHNEWGIAANHTYIQLIYYYVIYGLVYANLQFISGFVLRKPLGEHFAGIFVCFLTFNTGIWVLGNMILGLLGIPY